MLKYGFELEGFYCGNPEYVEYSIPPKDYPTDGFPGLVELRSSGANFLPEAYCKVIQELIKYPDVSTCLHEFTFTPKDRAELRRRHEVKSSWNIRNLYGKYPRPLGNKTIASLQINISNLLRGAYTDNKGVYFADSYGLLDVPQIVRNLDEEFEQEIKDAKRQPGEYCIKNAIRLEYRSLPNFVFPRDPLFAKHFLDRIEKCVMDFNININVGER